MLQVNNNRVELNETLEESKLKFCRKFSIKEKDITYFELAKKSIDARDKKDIFYICGFYVDGNFHINKKLEKTSRNITKKEIEERLPFSTLTSKNRPIVIGAGPAGLFATYTLAKIGLKPILFERGKDVDSRSKDIDDFFNNHELNLDSNVQFGEGGAGTFSDGKLMTSSNDRNIRILLNEFVDNGAPSEIKYLAHPHIGSDKLKEVVKNIRYKILNLGGEVYFEHKLVDFSCKDDEVTISIEHNGNMETYVTNDLVLALGHSARDTFEMLYQKNMYIEPKNFAMGVRIEHLQDFINTCQYGDFKDQLPAAEYKFVEHFDDGRMCYSFCMCPGGEIVASTSEYMGNVTNGMSLYNRDSEFANSALLVNVNKEDFMNGHPLDGVHFQEKYERLAYELCDGYDLGVQTAKDFIDGKISTELPFKDNCRMSSKFVDLSKCLPSFVTSTLKQGLKKINSRVNGFTNDAILYGIESRTSSPIRIKRDETYQSVSHPHIYPVGEGAGYSGGITTSALDGIRAARLIIKKYSEENND